MRALITGIAGFVGSHLAEYLLSHTSAEVWGTIHENTENIEHIKGRLRLLSGDLQDPDFVQETLQESQPDYLFHLAAQSYVPHSWENPWETLEINLRPELNLFQEIAKDRLAVRILIVGSNEEYGRVLPEELPLKETAPLRPDSPYGVSKVAQDFLGLQYHISHGLEVIRVRPFNHIGPRQREEFVVPTLAKQIAEIEAGLRKPVVKVGNLESRRDFTDVRDMVRAYYLAITQGETGEVYNVGSGVARAVREVLNSLLALTIEEIAVSIDPARLRPSDVPMSFCDASKFRGRTGWEPSIPFEKSLEDTLDYWRHRITKGSEKD